MDPRNPNGPAVAELSGAAETAVDDVLAAGDGSRLTARLLVLLGLGALAGYVLFALLRPFLPAIVTSATFAALFYPVHIRLLRIVRHPSAAAMIGTLLIFFLVLLPVLGLSLLLANETRAGIEWLGMRVSGLFSPESELAAFIARGAEFLGVHPAAISDGVERQLQLLGGTIAGTTWTVLSGIGGWFLQAGAALFTLYYLLRDGERLVGAVTWLIPLDAARSRSLIVQARDVTYATVYGSVAVAAAQGVLGGLAFVIVGLPAAALWGTAMGLLSLLPAVGAALIWFPAGVGLLLQGEVGRGIALLVMGTALVSTVDNLLRAVLVSNRAKLHPLIVFFSVLGGLYLFGAAGVVVGPVLFVAALALIEIARASIDHGRMPVGVLGILSRTPDDDPLHDGHDPARSRATPAPVS